MFAGSMATPPVSGKPMRLSRVTCVLALFAFSLSARAWSEADSLAVIERWSWPAGTERSARALAAYRDTLFAGGYDQDGQVFRSLGTWDEDNGWHEQLTERSLPRTPAQQVVDLAVVNDRLFVLASFDAGACSFHSELFVYDGSWLPPLPLPNEEGLRGVGLDRLEDELLLFARVGNSTATPFAWNGRSWLRLPTPPVEDCGVQFEVLGDGKLYAHSGRQEHYLDEDFLDQRRLHYAIYRYDSPGWTTIKKGTGGSVQSLLHHDGELYASFGHVHDWDSLHSVERWDGDRWHAVGPRLSQGSVGQGAVSALIDHHGVLLAAGYFSRIGDFASTGIVAWNGETWRPVPTRISSMVGPKMWSMHDTLWITGALWKPGEGQHVNLARFDGPIPLDAPLRWPAQPEVCVQRKLPPLPEFTNGTFANWENDLPAGWELRSGQVEPSPGGSGILLTNPIENASRFAVLSQRFQVGEGPSLRVRMRARVLDAGKGRMQPVARFEVSVGEPYDILILESNEWKTYELVLPAKGETRGYTSVMVLAPGGTIEIQEVRAGIADLGPADAFDEFSRTLRAQYIGFDRAAVDVDSLLTYYRTAASRAVNRQAFENIAGLILREIDDRRIALWSASSDVSSCRTTGSAEWLRMPSDAARAPDVLDDELRNHGVRVGDVEPGITYVQPWDMPGIFDDQSMKDVAARITQAKAVIFDLRGNGGRENCDYSNAGENGAESIASRFATRPTRYGSARSRAGAARDLVLDPQAPDLSEVPVVVLVDDRTCNSGALLAMMMKALPNAQLVGQATRGTGGSSEPISLCVGIRMHFPTVDHLDLSGKLIEDRSGLEPHVLVDYDPTRDAAFEVGLVLLRERVGR